MLTRAFVATLEARLGERRPRPQVVLGPRQVGKTTGVRQLMDRWRGPSHYASADDLLGAPGTWIDEQWQTAREKGANALLVLDEIQKAPRWAETLKRLWDGSGGALRVVLLGSSSLRLQRGLTESLAGRFELVPVPHWNWEESRRAFGLNLPTYLRIGGYPGSYRYRRDHARWHAYLKSAVVDAVIGQDILTQQTVAKPALFRQAFEILCGLPAQEVSYNTLLGQLQDKGNVDLVKHYLELYEGAFLFRSLFKFSGRVLRTKSSSPKILPLCPAFHTLAAGAQALENPEKRGHAFEALVGADLVRQPGATVHYWREADAEVDYVVAHEGALFAVEVKSGRRRSPRGLAEFKKRYPAARTVFITWENYPTFSHDPLGFLAAVSP